jgi:hypothetical protein
VRNLAPKEDAGVELLSHLREKSHDEYVREEGTEEDI